jgi:hypothetical protein
MENNQSRIATKLVILHQCQLELLDDLQGTTLYRQDIKFLTNQLIKKLEEHLDKYLKTLDDDEKEFSFLSIQRGMQKLLDLSLEELHELDPTIKTELNGTKKETD